MLAEQRERLADRPGVDLEVGRSRASRRRGPAFGGRGMRRASACGGAGARRRRAAAPSARRRSGRAARWPRRRAAARCALEELLDERRVEHHHEPLVEQRAERHRVAVAAPAGLEEPGPPTMKPSVCSARGSRGPGGRPCSAVEIDGGACSVVDIVTRDRCTRANSARTPGSAPARPRRSPRGRRASAGAPAAGSSDLVIVTFRSGRRARARPIRSARQPASSSIALARDDHGRTAREVARADAHRSARARVLEVAPAGSWPPASRSSTYSSCTSG